jgi:hypothetical protein
MRGLTVKRTQHLDDEEIDVETNGTHRVAGLLRT